MARTNPETRGACGTAQAGLAIAAALAGVGFALACAAAPRAEAQSIAVVFAPGTAYPEAADRLAALDARIVRIGRFQNVFVAHFEQGWSLASLWRIGALLPLDARAGGDCGIATRIVSLSSTTNAAN